MHCPKGSLVSPSLPRHFRRFKEGRKESLQHPWQPTRLNGWNSVCLSVQPICSTRADELHGKFDCPHFSAIRADYSSLIQDAEGCMRLFMLHKHQKAVSRSLTADLHEA